MKQVVQKRSKKPLIIILSFVALLLVILGVAFGLALSDPNVPITASGQTNTGVVKIIKAAVTGAPAHLSAEEMNAILAEKLAGGSQTKVRGVRFTINPNDTVDVYLPIDYKGVKFGMSGNLTFGAAAEKQISATVNSIRIGRLPVNPAWLLQYGKEVLPKEISVNGSVLQVDSSLIGTYILANDAPASISSLTVADQSFVVGVSSNLDKLKEYIEQNLKSYIGLLG